MSATHIRRGGKLTQNNIASLLFHPWVVPQCSSRAEGPISPRAGDLTGITNNWDARFVIPEMDINKRIIREENIYWGPWELKKNAPEVPVLALEFLNEVVEDIVLVVGSSHDSLNRRKARDIMAPLRTSSEVVRDCYAAVRLLPTYLKCWSWSCLDSVKLQPKVTCVWEQTCTTVWLRKI